MVSRQDRSRPGSTSSPATAGAGRGKLFAIWRHHVVFTDTALTMLAAEASHRGHAIIENVIVDLEDGALASRFHARATTAAIRAQLIAVPARIARSARRLRLHLPERWPWETAWQAMLTAAAGPPACATRPPSPSGRNQGPEVEDPDRPAPHPRPNQKQHDSDAIRAHRKRTGGSRLKGVPRTGLIWSSTNHIVPGQEHFLVQRHTPTRPRHESTRLEGRSCLFLFYMFKMP